jgi:predicted PolB exonuclease-like 3'-5' exonuclease
MNVYLDIETIPRQGAYPEFLAAETESFTAPSSLTKAKACSDLGLIGDDAKYTSKDDAIAKWCAKFAAEKAPEVAGEKWRKTALDANHGEIAVICLSIDGETVAKFNRVDGSEVSIIVNFLDYLHGILDGRKPYFVGHNIPFDLRFLHHRAIITGTGLQGFNFPFAGRHGHDYFDTMQEWEGFKGRISQDRLCKLLGIEGKPDGIDGSKVWDYWKAGKYSEVADYCQDDVEKVIQMYKRITG